MKHLMIILGALLICSNLWAEKKVELRKRRNEGADRSEICVNLTAISDQKIITFISETNIESFYYEVRTITNEILLSETFSLIAGQTYTTSIGEVESDVYILEVKINGEIYSGYLEIY